MIVGIEEKRRKESRTTAEVLKLYVLRAAINLVILAVLLAAFLVIYLVTSKWAPNWLSKECQPSQDTTLAKEREIVYICSHLFVACLTIHRLNMS